MRSKKSLAPLAFGLATLLLAAAFMPVNAKAEGKTPQAPPNCTCPNAREPAPASPWPRPKFAEVRPSLDTSDEIAVLEALQLALTEVGDGSSYVWHRRNGRLSGVVQPTGSFKDLGGRICRHIVIMLSAGDYSRRTEGIACRLASGAWQLEG